MGQHIMIIYILEADVGDCFVIDFNNGKCILIDGGIPNTSAPMSENAARACSKKYSPTAIAPFIVSPLTVK